MQDEVAGAHCFAGAHCVQKQAHAHMHTHINAYTYEYFILTKSNHLRVQAEVTGAHRGLEHLERHRPTADDALLRAGHDAVHHKVAHSRQKVRHRALCRK